MKTTLDQEEYFVVQEIFRQLQASKVNGFPFLKYTGVKPFIFSSDILYLKLPKNPSKFKSILVMYEHGPDTYKVQFYTHDDPLKKEDIHIDIYCDQLAQLIARKMGVL